MNAPACTPGPPCRGPQPLTDQSVLCSMASHPNLCLKWDGNLIVVQLNTVAAGGLQLPEPWPCQSPSGVLVVTARSRRHPGVTGDESGLLRSTGSFFLIPSNTCTNYKHWSVKKLLC